MIIALDIGTSSARASAWQMDGEPIAGRFHQARYEPRVTPDGGVEHDPAALLDAVAACLDAVCARGAEVAGVGVTTFWHGLCGFDGAGRAVTPIYTWADSRSEHDAALLRDALDEPALHARTGCYLHSSYWPAKLRWLARERPSDAGRIARWGSFGEYLELALFGDAATSVSMASATGLRDAIAGAWDAEAVAAGGIEPRQLFRVVDRDEPRRGLRAPWAGRWPPLRGAAWFPAVGDGAAGNVGSDCIEPGRIALNVGTSAALRAAVDGTPAPPRGLWRYSVDRRQQLLGGATSEGGNVWAWCRDTLRLPDDATLEQQLDAMAPDSHGLTVLPFLAGERAPGWRGDRRGVIAGLRLDSGPLEIARAALEAVALRLALVYRLLAPQTPAEHVIVASGGAITRSRVWSQMLADALGHPVSRSHEPEATSRGAALLALQALGVLPDLRRVRAPLGETFEPDPARHARYRDAVERQQALDDRV
ncbi:MAG TPA: gluconokinase [Methylomirabilota bacterium]|nr:gluconokinase [Methylomirabilota bacterium]